MFEESRDFYFVNFRNTDITGIELLIPEFKGVVFHYHKAGVEEIDGAARLSFGYTVVHPGEHDIDDLNSDEKFHTIMGDLLTQFLMAKVDDETRNDNPEEPDLL